LKGTADPMPNFRDIMIDLETLASCPRAHVIQIAAIAFDRETGELGSRFSVYVRGEQPGRVIDPATVAWWMQQHHAPFIGAELSGSNAVSLCSALLELAEWYVARNNDAPCVWSHGATFDLPILQDAYQGIDESVPWGYRSGRDTRTIYDVAPGGMPAVEKDPEQEHDALYDCEIQIKQVVGALHEIELAKAALERHRTGMSEVLNQIMALGLGAEADAVADTQPARVDDPWGEGGMPAGSLV
jgi:hypothetical protein